MSHKKLEARVHGFVQGVGFRYFVKEKALKLGLCGYAKNLADGSVEVTAEGEEGLLLKLLSLLNKGNSYSEVKNVEYSLNDSVNNLIGFEIY